MINNKHEYPNNRFTSDSYLCADILDEKSKYQEETL